MLKPFFFTFFLISLSALASSVPPPSLSDFLIIAGVSVGPFNSSTSMDNLIKRFGTNAVTISDRCGAEGGKEYCVTVAGQSKDEGLIFYPDHIEISDRRYRTPEGVHVGMNAAELMVLNEVAFAFAGFEIGGYIESFGAHGKLQAIYDKKLTFFLGRKDGAAYSTVKPLRVNKVISSMVFPDKKAIVIQRISNVVGVAIDFSKLRPGHAAGK